MILNNYPITATGPQSLNHQSWWRNKQCITYRDKNTGNWQMRMTGSTGYSISHPVLSARLSGDKVLYLIEVRGLLYIRILGGATYTTGVSDYIDDYLWWNDQLWISHAGQVRCITAMRSDCLYNRTVKFAAFEVDGKEVLYHVCFHALGPIGPYSVDIYAHDNPAVCLAADRQYTLYPLSSSYRFGNGVTIKSCGTTIADTWTRPLHRYLPRWWQERVAEARIIMIALPTEIFEIIVSYWFYEEALLAPLGERSDRLLWTSLLGDYLRLNV